MNRNEFQKMLIALAQNFSHDLQKEKLSTLTKLAEAGFGFNHNWEKVTVDIAFNEKYFPTIAVIKKYLKIEINEHSPPQLKAEVLVDRFIAFLQKRLGYEDISKTDREYCIARFDCDRAKYETGKVNLDFKRREWVEIAAHDFEFGTHKQLAIESPRVLELLTNKAENKNAN